MVYSLKQAHHLQNINCVWTLNCSSLLCTWQLTDRKYLICWNTKQYNAKSCNQAGVEPTSAVHYIGAIIVSHSYTYCSCVNKVVNKNNNMVPIFYEFINTFSRSDINTQFSPNYIFFIIVFNLYRSVFLHCKEKNATNFVLL